MAAQIMKIIKPSKQIEHEALVTAIQSIKFQTFEPSVKIIKQSIEYLIKRDYLRRNAANKNIYEYVV